MASTMISANQLPRPSDDGACDHLVGMALPHLRLPSTAGDEVDLAEPRPGWTIIFCYPRTAVPGQALPDGWEAIPGAVGCTPQACSFRDRFSDLRQCDATIFGVSTQTSEYQLEMAHRLKLPYPVLSDAELTFAKALRLPIFDAGGVTLIKRLTLIAREGRIEHLVYPVFPPEESAAEVVDWLQQGRPGSQRMMR